MTCREPKIYHVFLREPFTLANLANSLAQGAEELGVIDHAPVLWGHEQKHHEQISWPQNYRGAQLFDRIEIKAASRKEGYPRNLRNRPRNGITCVETAEDTQIGEGD